MSRRYYDTVEKVYSLLLNHPSVSPLLNGFGISNTQLKDVAKYLIANEDTILNNSLNAYYIDSDMLDSIAELYGYTTKPYKNYTTGGGGTYLELLQLTIYLFKFGVTDNFYEKHFLDFIPEYDRTQVENAPKLKLTIESLGRKLDQMEDMIARASELYDIDTCPEDFLDYLGQNLGYEREDYTLNNVSFRELLKNIIEIYKIKGTNYSFTFFFKFLGFEIDLKEFYFNKDVENPEGFPGMTTENVEYYLTTTNPLKQTGKNTSGNVLHPAKYLRQTRNLDDFKVEFASLTAAGCTNAIAYMLGNASYNGNGLKYHSNPWEYFKANLIEYELDPFISKVNLTASDNETIKKYVKFLSPTYLFTWININLTPWSESINIVTDYDDNWGRTVTKVLGDPRPTPSPWPQLPQGLPGVPVHDSSTPWVKKTSADAGFTGPYYDYEDLLDITIFKTGGESLIQEIGKALNLDGADQFGTVLRRNGEHYRQPGNPRHITDAYHRADKRLCYDSITIDIKGTDETDYTDYSAEPFPTIPTITYPSSGLIIETTNIAKLEWDSSYKASEYWLQIATDSSFTDTDAWRSDYLVTSVKVSDVAYTYPNELANNEYYWRIRSHNSLTYDETDTWSNYTKVTASGYTPEAYIHKTGWGPWSDIYNFSIKTRPFPFNNETIDKETNYVTPLYEWNSDKTIQSFIYASFNLLWPSTSQTSYYEIQFNNATTVTTSTTNSLSKDFTNGTYTWKYRAKTTSGDYTDWSDTLTFTVNFPTTK